MGMGECQKRPGPWENEISQVSAYGKKDQFELLALRPDDQIFIVKEKPTPSRLFEPR